MRSPVHTIAIFCTAVWMGVFVLNRFVMLRQAWEVEYVRWNNDQFVAMEICSNNTLRANLGQDYEHICHKATVDSQVWPMWRAVHTVLRNTHLCGDVPCTELIDHFLETLSRSMAWTLACLCVTLFLIIIAGLYFGTKRMSVPTHKYDLEHTRLSIEEGPAPVYNNAPPTPKRKSTKYD